ncbi:MAG: XdhC family protein, partial [Alphaproteobacteria bacterium]
VQTLKNTVDWHAAGRACVLVTVIATWGSSPRPAGSNMLVSATGEMVGSVSGGCVETAIVGEAVQMIAQGTATKVLGYGVTNEMAWEVGLACGGVLDVFLQLVEKGLADAVDGVLKHCAEKTPCALIRNLDTGKASVCLAEEAAGISMARTLVQGVSMTFEQGDKQFFQSFLPPKRLIIVGGVHLAQALVAQAGLLGLETILIDPRVAFANDQRFGAVQVINQWPDEALESLKLDAQTALVTLSHDPKIDDLALIYALKQADKVAYIGALGSKNSHEQRKKRLLQAGIGLDRIAEISGPVGLDIKAVTPAEIAVSIVAEMISAYANNA